ncbi:DUF3093 family protein [Glutamicibacter sp. JL.03c]|uniref:DUF3093 family protein n=1 Tax=Glutamicibacter sp. JL.03c TaxID=2984842 RepID=UPI0021F70834|nr:DUF3093 family protein [Glutamicibacter sp. JL.03c]UYQ79206.1 DUF3093 family protein [Glutamicibacter sp. JL.03c]
MHTVKNRPWLYVVLILPVIIVLGIYLPLASRLPELIATHWSSTYPDEFTRTEIFVPMVIGLSIVGSLIGLSSLAQTRRPALLLTLLFVGSLLSWTTAGVFIGSVIPTALAETPQTAVIGIWMLPMAACTLLALSPLWISGVYQSYSKQQQAQRQARMSEAQGNTALVPQGTGLPENVEFSETMKAPWWLWMLGLVVAGIGIFALIDSYNRSGQANWTATIISLVVCLIVCPLVLGLCRIRVSITEQRTKVTSALFGFPLRTIKPEEIESVTSTEIDPMAWGGWGWRFFPGGSAVVLRRYEGLAFELKNSSRFAVTIPNSHEGAEQLNAIMRKNGS